RSARNRAVGRPAATALHRQGPGELTLHPADGRAVLGARPDRNREDRGTDNRAEEGIHHRDRHSQHAAGRTSRRPDRVLRWRRAGGVRRHRADFHDPGAPADRGLHHWEVRMSESQRHFHEELGNVKARLLTMSGEAEAALALAVEALLERDPDQAARAIASDRVIDGPELALERPCSAPLALQQPMARDLRMITSALKIANDLERVGDHAVNIAESAERLARARPITPEPELLLMARQARQMLADAIEAFIRGDSAAGREICRRDDEIDSLHRSMFRILLTHMMEDPHNIGSGMELFLVSRNLERVADLATNIAEDVVFL